MSPDVELMQIQNHQNQDLVFDDHEVENNNPNSREPQHY